MVYTHWNDMFIVRFYKLGFKQNKDIKLVH